MSTAPITPKTYMAAIRVAASVPTNSLKDLRSTSISQTAIAIQSSYQMEVTLGEKNFILNSRYQAIKDF